MCSVRFMTASGAHNVHAIEIEGDFDDCQRIVKAMFADGVFAQRANLSGVNSINWARIVAQSSISISPPQRYRRQGLSTSWCQRAISAMRFQGTLPRRLARRLARFVLATNSNDILARALKTGRYERAAQSYATLSPAMDIQLASNFERILFEACSATAAP
jgi:threonine synthase